MPLALMVPLPQRQQHLVHRHQLSLTHHSQPLLQVHGRNAESTLSWKKR